MDSFVFVVKAVDHHAVLIIVEHEVLTVACGELVVGVGLDHAHRDPDDNRSSLLDLIAQLL